MTASIKETSSTTRNIEIAIPQEALKAPFEKKVTRYRKEVQMKGFRAGAVPRNIIISRFGEMIRQEVVEELMNSTLSEELKKANIIPVSRVKVEDFKDEAIELFASQASSDDVKKYFISAHDIEFFDQDLYKVMSSAYEELK